MPHWWIRWLLSKSQDSYALILAGIPAAMSVDGAKQLAQFLTLSNLTIPVIQYRKITGEFGSASAVATALAASFLESGIIPGALAGGNDIDHSQQNKQNPYTGPGTIYYGHGTFQTMRILLVSPNTLTAPYPVYPLGLDYVAASISPEHEVQIADLNALSLPDLAEILAVFSPDIIGLSCRNIDNMDAGGSHNFIHDYAKNRLPFESHTQKHNCLRRQRVHHHAETDLFDPWR